MSVETATDELELAGQRSTEDGVVSNLTRRADEHAGGSCIWEYFHDPHWYLFDKASQEKLNAAVEEGQDAVELERWGSLQQGHKSYAIDLKNMLQTQMQTNTVRPIRCVRISDSARRHPSTARGVAAGSAGRDTPSGSQAASAESGGRSGLMSRRNVCLQPPGELVHVHVHATFFCLVRNRTWVAWRSMGAKH